MAGQTVTIILRADASNAVSEIGKVSAATEEMENRVGAAGLTMASVADTIRTQYLAITAASYALWQSTAGAWNMMMESMKIEAQAGMLDRLSKKYDTTASDIARDLQTASNGLISHADATQVAIKGIFAGLDPTQLTELMKVTSAAALANGITVSDAFERISMAAETGRVRALKQMGIIVDITKAQKEYAATVNTTVDNLTEEEKMTATVGAILARSKTIMDELGGPSDNLRTKIMQQSAAWKDLKESVGGVLAQLAGAAYSAFSALAKPFGESLATTDHTGGASGTWGGKGVAAAGLDIRPDDLTKLHAMTQKYRDEETIANARGRDKEYAALEVWYEEQNRMLADNSASQEQYTAMNAAYSAKFRAMSEAEDKKIVDAQHAEYEASMQKSEVDERAWQNARVKIAIDAAKEQAQYEEKLIADRMKTGNMTVSEEISLKAAAERVKLEQDLAELQSKEYKNMADMLLIQGQMDLTRQKIVHSKATEEAQLDARRLVLEREITDLTQKQHDLTFATQAKNAVDALNKAGGPISGTDMGTLLSIKAEQDIYTQQYKVFSDNQEAIIEKMEESLYARQELLRNSGATEIAIAQETAAQKAAISVAYGQYDLQYDAMVQQQKGAQASAYANIAMNTANALLSFSGGHAKAQFVIAKGLAVAMALIQGHTAAIGAAASVASTPYVGGALAAAAYAEWSAIGYANAAMIAATAIGEMVSGGGGSSVPSIGGGGGALSLSAPSAPASAPAQAKAAPVINITLVGMWGDVNEAAREIAPAIRRAFDDGVTG